MTPTSSQLHESFGVELQLDGCPAGLLAVSITDVMGEARVVRVRGLDLDERSHLALAATFGVIVAARVSGPVASWLPPFDTSAERTDTPTVATPTIHGRPRTPGLCSTAPRHRSMPSRRCLSIQRQLTPRSANR